MPRPGPPPIPIPSADEIAQMHAADEAFTARMREEVAAREQADREELARIAAAEIAERESLAVPVPPREEAARSNAPSQNALRAWLFDSPLASPPPSSADLKRYRETRLWLEGEYERCTAENHLKRLGLRAALVLLSELFGTAAVANEFRRPGQTSLPLSRALNAWVRVETRRSATGADAKSACEIIARRGGFKTRRQRRSGEIDTVRVGTKGQLRKLHSTATKALKQDTKLRDLWQKLVRRELAAWQESGKTFEAWEKGRLRW